MRSAGKPRVRGYHPSANDWTPLSRKPCWERRLPPRRRLCSAVTLVMLPRHGFAGPRVGDSCDGRRPGIRNPMLTTWTESGIVSGRVALLPRSVEVRPGFFTFQTTPPPARTRGQLHLHHFPRCSLGPPPPTHRGPAGGRADDPWILCAPRRLDPKPDPLPALGRRSTLEAHSLVQQTSAVRAHPPSLVYMQPLPSASARLPPLNSAAPRHARDFRPAPVASNLVPYD